MLAVSNPAAAKAKPAFSNPCFPRDAQLVSRAFGLNPEPIMNPLHGAMCLSLATLLCASPAAASCRVADPATYGDVQYQTLPVAIDRFIDRFCGPVTGRALRACLQSKDRTAIIYDIVRHGTATAAVFTYSYGSDPLGATLDDTLEQIGFVMRLRIDYSSGIPAEVVRVKPVQPGPFYLVLERTRQGAKIIEERLYAGEAVADKALNLSRSVEWTNAGAGWQRGGASGNTTPIIREARNAASISHAVKFLRGLAWYLCDTTGTPWHFPLRSR